jgi:hypothetical protein
MAPTKMTKCKFFARGFCKHGESCDFTHEYPTHTSALATGKTGIDLEALNLQGEEARSPRICTFFMQGACNKGDKCRYAHPPAMAQPPQVYSSVTSVSSCWGQEDKSAPQAPTDSRARVPCKFQSRPGGCRNDSCPFLHPVDSLTENSSRDFEVSNRSPNSRQKPILTLRTRTKRVTTVSLGTSLVHQSIIMNTATFSKSPFRQTSLLHALQVLHQEPLLKQSSISFVVWA